MRHNRNLQKQLQLNSHIGDIIASTGSKAVEITSSQPRVDRVFLRRFLGYQEFAYNELAEGALHPCVLDQYNFNKPFSWELCHDRAYQEISEHQYLMVFINLDTIGAEFTKVQEEDTIEILKTQYGLEAIKEM